MPPAFRRSPLALAILGVLKAGALHPYGIQRRLRQWGKDQVVNIGQRSQLYKTIARLEAAGYVIAETTERDANYPERTKYAITEAGEAVAVEWIADMIAKPHNEYPEFPAALSFAPMLPPERLRQLLEIRRDALTRQHAELTVGLATEIAGHRLPRVVLLDTELQHATVTTELEWVAGIIAALDDGSLTWTAEELIAQAEAASAASL